MRMKIIAVVALFFLAGCAHCRPPLISGPAVKEYVTAIHKDLISLPPPESKIVVAVYNFTDQTGQYKDNPSVSSFSTAVTQGAASMVIKALQDSGWFVPIERVGLSDVLTERKIVRSTREEYKQENQTLPPLPPLLYASVIIEGGIIGYETNTYTGGLGAKYFGAGGSAEFRRDQVTIYLRAVSVKNGAVLNNVAITKSILSKSLDLNFFRFVRFKRLLEVETGITTNEPVVICVKEAIEKAIFDLIVEGIIKKDWNLKNSEDIKSSVIQEYFLERSEKEGETKVQVKKPKQASAFKSGRNFRGRWEKK